MKTIALNQEIFNLYWNGHLQLRTPRPVDIAVILDRSIKRGEGLKGYVISSNFSDSYNCKEFLCQYTQP